MNFNITLNSLTIAVKDMDRAINFYENFFNENLNVKNEIFNVFNLNGFEFCLFDNEKAFESVSYGTNCLPSFEVNDINLIESKLNKLNAKITFPLTQINNKLVLNFEDSEGNIIEVYSKLNFK